MLNRLYKSRFFNPIYFWVKKSFEVFAYLIPYRYNQAKNPTLSLKIIKNYNKKRTLGPKKIICNAPFKHMYFKQNGDVTACCASSVDAYGNIRENSVNDIWNGEKVNLLRAKIRNFNLSGGCAGCQHSLESGNYNAFIGRIYDTLLPSPASAYPTEMTFEISNTCNLECIMCTGEFSNLIRKNVEKLPDIPNYYKEDFFDEIKGYLQNLKRIRFMGGEPFLIKQYEPIMEFLVEHNPSCKIYIQTNGTILNNFVKKIIESKNVEISISIDSLQKDMYEQIRKNGSYDRMMENLVYFSERAQKHQQLININFCVMNNNWNEVPDMIDFCDKNNFTLNLIPVERPRYLSLKACNSNYIDKVIYFSEAYLPKIQHKRLEVIYKDYVKYIRSLSDNSKKDEIRKETLLKFGLEELYSISQELYVNINSKHINIDQTSIDTIYAILSDLTDSEKKSIVSNFIIDLEKIKNEEADEKINDMNELIAHTKVFFTDMKKELSNPIFY